jgi:pyridoxine 5'-phosphate synthase PdxJ
MTKLSVNINKVATIRNARGGNVPDVCRVALDCEKFGAEGITVHPRPDERHIRYQDVWDLRPLLKTEFNIGGILAKDIMSKNPKTIEKEALAKEALFILKQNNIGQLIVTENGNYFGIIDLHRLLDEGIN